MFKAVTPPATFVAEAQITIPGSAEPGVFNVEWRYKSKQDLQAWIKAREGVDHLDSLSDVIAGWSELLDDHDQALPYSRDALAALLNMYPAAGRDLVGSYIAAVFASRLGN